PGNGQRAGVIDGIAVFVHPHHGEFRHLSQTGNGFQRDHAVKRSLCLQRVGQTFSRCLRQRNRQPVSCVEVKCTYGIRREYPPAGQSPKSRSLAALLLEGRYLPECSVPSEAVRIMGSSTASTGSDVRVIAGELAVSGWVIIGCSSRIIRSFTD